MATVALGNRPGAERGPDAHSADTHAGARRGQGRGPARTRPEPLGSPARVESFAHSQRSARDAGGLQRATRAMSVSCRTGAPNAPWCLATLLLLPRLSHFLLMISSSRAFGSLDAGASSVSAITSGASSAITSSCRRWRMLRSRSPHVAISRARASASCDWARVTSSAMPVPARHVRRRCLGGGIRAISCGVRIRTGGLPTENGGNVHQALRDLRAHIDAAYGDPAPRHRVVGGCARASRRPARGGSVRPCESLRSGSGQP